MSVYEPINDAESKKATQSVTGAYALSLHLQEMYETINVDKTNPLTAAELKAASGEASLTANQKASAKFLLDHFDTIASLSDPEATDQTIDPDDLKEVRLKAVKDESEKRYDKDRTYTALNDAVLPDLALFADKIGVKNTAEISDLNKQAKNLSDFLLKNFDRLDTNKDGQIRGGEMERLWFDKPRAPEQQNLGETRALGAIVKHDHGSNSGVSRDDARGLNKIFNAGESFDPFASDLELSKSRAKDDAYLLLGVGLAPAVVLSPALMIGPPGWLLVGGTAALFEAPLAYRAIREYYGAKKLAYGEGPERSYEESRRLVLEDGVFLK